MSDTNHCKKEPNSTVSPTHSKGNDTELTQNANASDFDALEGLSCHSKAVPVHFA